MKDSLRVVTFAAVLGVVCAGLLTGANRVLAPYQKANELAERLRNVFHVLDVEVQPGASAETLVRLAEQEVRERRVGELRLYEYDHPRAGRLRAIEFRGQGLWGPVEGLLCLRADLRTIFRVSFYKHEETPGLGGEIESEGFRSQFAGKVVGPEGVRIVRGKATAANEIDGISGATMTCQKVQAMLNDVLGRIADRRQEILREGGDGG
jgi:Na+-transporting NADH:ubiquinone oxidoreductase subunit C